MLFSNKKYLHCIFCSSPEHEVVMLSFSDTVMSIVRVDVSTSWRQDILQILLVLILEGTDFIHSSWNFLRLFIVGSWKLGHAMSKTRSLSQILEKPYVHNRDSQFLSVVCSLFPKAIFFTFISFSIESLWNVVKMFVWTITKISLNLGHVSFKISN